MAVAVVSEFNPFHNGHKYLLETAKNITNEGVIAVMSGSFTQRGEVALTDKFTRAKTALNNGADLVIELPTVYAVSNAQRFAKCGVEIAKAFDCVDTLAFGCESESADLLLSASIKQSDFPTYMMPFFALVMLEGRMINAIKEIEKERMPEHPFFLYS